MKTNNNLYNIGEISYGIEFEINFSNSFIIHEENKGNHYREGGLKM